MQQTDNKGFQDPYKTETKTPFSWRKPVVFIFVIVMGLYSMRFTDAAAERLGINSWLMILIDWLALVAFLLLGMMLNAVGKLVGGLVSGRQVGLFCCGPISLVREKGKFVRKKLPSVYHLGACMMTPKQGSAVSDTAWFLWNACGGIFNIIAAVLSLLVLVFCDNETAKWLASASFIAMTMLAMLYLIPSGEKAPNEGMNILTMKNDPQARVVEHNTLMIVGMEFDGASYADIPEELYECADPNGKALYADLAASKAFWLNGTGRFREAENLFYILMNNESIRSRTGMLNLCKLDLAFSRTMLGEDPAGIHELMDDSVIKYALGRTDTIVPLRTLYAYYLIVCRNMVKAEEIYNKAVSLRDNCLTLSEFESEMKIIEWLRAGKNGDYPFGK